jgi:hypothetical protein
MVKLLALGCALPIALSAGGATAQQVLYELGSPNAEFDGLFGLAVSGAGDVNNDGYDDVIVGAHSENTNSGHAGRGYIFSGATGELLCTLVSPNDQGEGHFGLRVSGAGDVNNDGYDDVIVGASPEDADYENAGRAYVFSGGGEGSRTVLGELLHSFVSPNPEPSGRFGGSVSGAGDVNNDGYDDLIVGASETDPWSGPLGEGRAYIFSGQTGGLLYTLVSPSALVSPNDPTGYFGNWVSDVGDVNSDGHDDVIVGAWYEDTEFLNAGKAHVFSGQTGQLLYTLVSPNPEANGHFGILVSGAGDVNNDGYPDVIVGALEDPGSSPREAGRAYVFSGTTGDLLHTLVSPNEETEGWFGVVSGAGDVNNDGCDDLLVGACYEDADYVNMGRAYVFSGETGLCLYELVSPNQESLEGSSSAYFGIAVSGAGDVNNDGWPDVIIGASSEDPGSSPVDAGMAYVFSFCPFSTPDVLAVGPSLVSIEGPSPNPTKGSVCLGLRALNGIAGEAELSLYDAMGRRIDTVLQRTIRPDVNVSLTWSPDADIPSGVYYWRLETDGYTTQKPMVLVK